MKLKILEFKAVFISFAKKFKEICSLWSAL